MPDQAQILARNFSMYLGITYEQSSSSNLNSDSFYNMFTLINPMGQVVFQYQKALPVVGVEADVVPGDSVLVK